MRSDPEFSKQNRGCQKIAGQEKQLTSFRKREMAVTESPATKKGSDQLPFSFPIDGVSDGI